MNQSRVWRKKWLTVLAGALATVSFLVISSYAIVWANGWLFDRETKTFTKTVLISIESPLDNVEIYLNSNLVARRAPIQFRHLPPDRYEVRIEKTGFYPWVETFQLAAGQVGRVKGGIRLIAQSPLVARTDKIFGPKQTSLFDVGLSLEKGELLDQGRLITRFNVSPNQVHRYNQGYLYQLGQDLRLFFPAGTQDYWIYRTNSQEPVTVTLIPSSWQLVVFEPTEIKLISLTIASGPEAASP